MKNPYHRPKENKNMARSLTKEQKIDKRIKSIGRSLSPTYKIGRPTRALIQKEWDGRSSESLARLNARSKRECKKLVRVVDGKLQVHSISL